MEHSTVSITDNNTQRFRYRKMEGALRLRQLDFCSQIACDLYWGESGGILQNHIQLDEILTIQMES